MRRGLVVAVVAVGAWGSAGCDSSGGGTPGVTQDAVGGDGVTLEDGVSPGDDATADDTSSSEDTGSTGRHHPLGWSDPTAHGPAFNAAGPEACGLCHGADLTGGTTGVGCATCHAAVTTDWTTDCTFCHGGADNATGAPPEAINGESARSFIGVGAHSAHVEDTALHAAFGCTTCHPALPESIFSAGHIDGDGVAENAFSGVAAGTTFTATSATCSAVYCHGNPNGSPGTVVWTEDPTLSCSSCHPTNGTGMSGAHRKHISHGVSCNKCHADVASSASAISGPALQVNGQVDVRLSQGTYTSSTGRCSGVCHGAENG